jgi:hypothetical protein
MTTIFEEWGRAEGAIVDQRGDPLSLWTAMVEKVTEAAATEQ